MYQTHSWLSPWFFLRPFFPYLSSWAITYFLHCISIAAHSNFTSHKVIFKDKHICRLSVVSFSLFSIFFPCFHCASAWPFSVSLLLSSSISILPSNKVCSLSRTHISFPSHTHENFFLFFFSYILIHLCNLLICFFTLTFACNNALNYVSPDNTVLLDTGYE